MHALIPYLIVSFIYLAVAVDFWRVAKSDEKNLKLHSTMIGLALALHGWLLYNSIIVTGFNFGFYHAVSAIFWLTVVIYWLLDFKHNLYSLQAFVLPPAAIVALLPAITAQNHYMKEIEGTLFIAHITIALIAYSLFTFAALHTMLMAVAERSLHQKTSLLKLPEFPPLMTMEYLLFKVITIGFILLTLTLISGIFFSEQIFGKAMQFNHKTIFSIASWLIYAGLLWGRHTYGWRGRKAIIWSQTGFLLLLLAYIGSKFVLEVVLHR